MVLDELHRERGARQQILRADRETVPDAAFPDGDKIEYRNEDTDWGFPFYFKFDSARLANEAANLKSTEASPQWVIVRHYGWRIPWLSMFPNALSVPPNGCPASWRI